MTGIDASETAAETAFSSVVSAHAPLFAVLDAARDPNGRYEAEQAELECRSLFAGELGDMLEHVAPQLVTFRRSTSFADWWFQQWGRSIGVLVEAPVTLDELRRHLRTLLTVRGPGHDRYYFRFYDPRVLRVYLPVCTADEIRRFFGPIRAFYCESDGGGELLGFRQDGATVAMSSHPVGAPLEKDED
jgi:hypothetical protein